MTSTVRGDTHATPSDLSASRLTDPHRLAVLRDSGLLHGASNLVLDGLARVTAHALGVPIAFVSLVDDRRQHLPGLAGPYGPAGETRGTPLSHACAHEVVLRDAPVVISDVAWSSDAAGFGGFRELGGVAFAGVPLRRRSGEVLGALCAVHITPVRWRAEHLSLLEDLAAAAAAEIERLLATQALARAEATWQAQAERDAQTGLFNRRGFAEHTRHHLALAQRTAAPFSIAVVDIDQFRHINDVFGHDAGDRAIAEMAVLLRAVSRETDLIARLDGDAFALLLCNTSSEEADRFTQRFDEALTELNGSPGREYQLHATLGVASWTLETPHTLATLLRVAEESMHIEKGHRAGRHQSVVDRLSPGGLPD